MSIDIDILKIEAQLEEDAILKDKSPEYIKGFREGYNFLYRVYKEMVKKVMELK